MAGTVLVAQPVHGKLASVAPALVAAASQMEMPNTGHCMLHVKATGAVTVTATNQTASPEGSANPNKAVALTTGQERMIAFDRATYNMGNGNVQLAFDTPANATVTVYQVAVGG